jgi:hypothetical protein
LAFSASFARIKENLRKVLRADWRDQNVLKLEKDMTPLSDNFILTSTKFRLDV